MRLIYCCVLFIFFTTVNAQALLCPNNFNTIQYGDSESTVEAACGAPKEKLVATEKTVEKNKITQWFYRFDKGTDVPPKPAPITFHFKDDKVYEIFVAGEKTENVICRNGTVNIDDRMQSVAAACNVPTYKHVIEETLDKEKEISQWIYEVESHHTKWILEFSEGKLSSARQE